MSGAIPRRLAFLAEHHVDHTSTGAEALIANRLRDHGLVTLDGLADRRAVLRLASRVMCLVPHRDSDPDGLTTIHHLRRHTQRAGFAGLGPGELAPHTERSGVPVPPRLMLLACERKAETGGECLLTDGRAVHADLAVRAPEALALLSAPRTAFFGDGNGHASQVFTVSPGPRVSVRLRQDDLARWSPFVEPYLPVLREAVIRHQHRLDLAPGQAYLLDNTRWLHARTRFAGGRRFLRALGRSRFAMADGFSVDRDVVIEPLMTEAA